VIYLHGKNKLNKGYMEVKFEKMKESKVKFNITLEPKELVKYIEHAFDHAGKDVKLPGFRPGKAPRAMIESSVGISRILSEAIDMAINESYMKAMAENKINPMTSPNVVINKYPNYGMTAEEIEKPLEFELTVTTFPDVEIGDLSKAKVEKPTKESPSEDDVEKVVDSLRKRKATFKEIDRAAEKGDFAELTYEGSIKHVKIDQMCSKNHPLVLGENTLIPGFEDGVVGMKKGEKKEIKLKFPKDYHSKEYAGKDAVFAVELVNVQEVIMPEIDEKFAADFGQKNEKELREAIKQNLSLEYDKKYEEELEHRILDAVLPLVKSDIPAEMIDKEVDRLVTSYQGQIKSMGLGFEEYLASVKKTLEDLKKDMRGAAEKNIKIGLMLGKIAVDQKFGGHDEEAGKKAIDFLVKTVVK